MTKVRKTHSKQTKFKAVLEMLKNEKTLSILSTEYGVHTSVLLRWKKTFLDAGPSIFEDGRQKSVAEDSTPKLQRKIGELVMENDFLKKVLGQ